MLRSTGDEAADIINISSTTSSGYFNTSKHILLVCLILLESLEITAARKCNKDVLSKIKICILFSFHRSEKK